MPNGFIYVLHFDKPLHHAQHYCGCTVDIRQRLMTHATGRGARIVQAAMEAGITWRLAALATTHVTGMRKIERQIKNWHGLAELCPICNPERERKIPGATAYPPTLLPFETDDASLRLLAAQVGTYEPFFRFSGESDTLGLAEEVKRLSKHEKDALGFIPAGGDGGITVAMVNGRLALCHVNGRLAGYCLFTHNEATKLVRIHQVIVRDEHRRCGIGRDLVTMVLDSHRRSGFRIAQAKVRDDLLANEFWKGIGFEVVGVDTHETSGSALNVYRFKLSEGTDDAV